MKLKKVANLMKLEKMLGLKEEKMESYLPGGWESKEPKEEEFTPIK